MAGIGPELRAGAGVQLTRITRRPRERSLLLSLCISYTLQTQEGAAGLNRKAQEKRMRQTKPRSCRVRLG